MEKKADVKVSRRHFLKISTTELPVLALFGMTAGSAHAKNSKLHQGSPERQTGESTLYNAGFCTVNGCHCHQYVGASGPCGNCGHNKAQHL